MRIRLFDSILAEMALGGQKLSAFQGVLRIKVIRYLPSQSTFFFLLNKNHPK